MTPLKMTPLKTFTYGALAALTLTLSAQALPKADTDQDGQVSQSEFMAQANARFSQTDSNHDGLLSREERSAAHDAMRGEKKAEQFTRLDTNGDGVLSQTEFMTKAERPNRSKNAGSDAATEGKKRGMRQKGGAQHEGAAQRGNDFDENNRDDGMRYGAGMRLEFLSPVGSNSHWGKADTDNDGFISRAEYDAQAKAMFEKLDRNDDGVLSKDDHRRRGKRRQK